MIIQVKTVGIYVQDQQKSLEFYAQQLGFEVRRDEPMGPEARWIEVAPKGAQTCLVPFPKSMMPEWEKSKPSVVFRCHNLESTYRELTARGVKFTAPPTKESWGVYAKFVDPDGNEFVLV